MVLAASVISSIVGAALRGRPCSPYDGLATTGAATEGRPYMLLRDRDFLCDLWFGRRSPARTIDPLVVPKAQIQQTPKEERVVSTPGSMFVKQAPHETVIEQLASPQRRIEKRVLDEPPKTVKHPLVDRHAEALLPATQNAVGNGPLQRALQNVFCLTLVILESRGYRHRKLDKLVIQKRHPRFDRSRHRHLVYAHQEQLRQPQLQFLIDHPVKLIRIRLRGQQPVQVRANHRV